jgi:NAD(P)-dependent dehydrogenase (short-subunit alcohol dehydrogenase family)
MPPLPLSVRRPGRRARGGPSALRPLRRPGQVHARARGADRLPWLRIARPPVVEGKLGIAGRVGEGADEPGSGHAPLTSGGAPRTILITGCSSGIGLDAARTLAARGWRVLATCRAEADCARLAGEGLESFPLDLDDEASVAAGAGEALARTGGAIDALFNNGAFALPGAVEDLPRAGLRAIFETNLFGQIDLTNRIIPAMRARGHGRIVMNSSVLGFFALPYRGAYNATKFALEGITDTLRREMAGTGIHVVLIEPGPIATPFREKSVPHFERYIDWRASARRADYEARVMPRLYGPPGHDRFELPPAAVTAQLVRALDVRRPAARYRVTTPTKVSAWLRRLLPDAALDAIARRR